MPFQNTVVVVIADLKSPAMGIALVVEPNTFQSPVRIILDPLHNPVVESRILAGKIARLVVERRDIAPVELAIRTFGPVRFDPVGQNTVHIGFSDGIPVVIIEAIAGYHPILAVNPGLVGPVICVCFVHQRPGGKRAVGVEAFIGDNTVCRRGFLQPVIEQNMDRGQ